MVFEQERVIGTRRPCTPLNRYWKRTWIDNPSESWISVNFDSRCKLLWLETRNSLFLIERKRRLEVGVHGSVPVADLEVRLGLGVVGVGRGRWALRWNGKSWGRFDVWIFFIYEKIIFSKGNWKNIYPFCFLTTKVSVFKFLNTSKIINNCRPTIQFIQIM